MPKVTGVGVFFAPFFFVFVETERWSSFFKTGTFYLLFSGTFGLLFTVFVTPRVVPMVIFDHFVVNWWNSYLCG
jgi:hypothetical protein